MSGLPRSAQTGPKLSVVLSVTDGLEATIEALQTVLDTCSIAGRIEVIVVDNGSTDGTHAVLAELSDDVQVARLSHPVPPRAAWMQGASMATGQLILFLSNDVRLRAGFLMPLVRSLAGEGRAPRPSCARWIGTARPAPMTNKADCACSWSGPTWRAGGRSRSPPYASQWSPTLLCPKQLNRQALSTRTALR